MCPAVDELKYQPSTNVGRTILSVEDSAVDGEQAAKAEAEVLRRRTRLSVLQTLSATSC